MKIVFACLYSESFMHLKHARTTGSTGFGRVTSIIHSAGFTERPGHQAASEALLQ